MDFLSHGYLSARVACDYTFNFWNDYLGLTTLVTKSGPRAAPPGPNSITESLKATLGLEDPCGVDGVPSGSAPPLLDLRGHLPFLGPLSPLPERDSPLAGGLELLCAAERRARKPSATRTKQEPRVCVFCRNNGAPEEVFGSHVLKSPEGRVLCPILRAYTCPLCSANGDHAHTIKYCPLPKEQPSARAPKSGRAVGGGGGKRLKIF